MEGVGAVPGRFHGVGELAEGGLDPVAPLNDDLLQGLRHGLALLIGRRYQVVMPCSARDSVNAAPLKPLSFEQPDQVFGVGAQVDDEVAFVERGGHDRPGADQPRAQVGAPPTGTRSIIQRARRRGRSGRTAGWARPIVRAADPAGALDRQRGGCRSVPSRRPRPRPAAHLAELLVGAVEPADTPVDPARVGQRRTHRGPLAADLGKEPGPGLAASAQQVPDQCDSDDLRIGTGWGRARSRRCPRHPVATVPPADHSPTGHDPSRGQAGSASQLCSRSVRRH